MFRKVVAAGLVAAVTFAVAVVAEARSITLTTVHGRLTPTATSGTEHGGFVMKSFTRGNGNHVERIVAGAKHLNVSGASAQNPPSFHVFLVLADGSGAADFGAMRVNRRGNAGFIFDTRKTSLPSGVNTITDFGGGTMEVRDAGGNAVCSGHIPRFNVVVGDAQSRFHPVSTSGTGKGEIDVHSKSTPSVTHEDLVIKCGGLAGNTSYAAVAIASDSTETSIGNFTTNRRGFGGLRLQDTAIPSGLSGLAGQTVEIRDGNGAVLTGTFPTIPQ